MKAMSTFEDLQIKPIYHLIDIWLIANEVTNIMLREKKFQHDLFPQKIIKDVGNVRSNLSNSLVTLYECLDIVNISINSQFVRTVMTENVSLCLKIFFTSLFCKYIINENFHLFSLLQILSWLILEKIH